MYLVSFVMYIFDRDHVICKALCHFVSLSGEIIVDRGPRCIRKHALFQIASCVCPSVEKKQSWAYKVLPSCSLQREYVS